MNRSNRHTRRRGAIAPFAAVLAAFLLGLVAFAVDVGWIVLTKNQLQNAADAAALAGVDALMDAHVQYYLAPTSDAKKVVHDDALAAARTLAKQYAAHNGAGDASSLTLRDDDIEFGFVNASGSYSSTYSGFPNTIKVLIRRDKDANGSLGLFFGPVMGRSSQDLTATASATAMAGQVSNFDLNNPWNVGMLPMTYDVDHWNTFIRTGIDPDGNALKDADGKPQLQVYPSIMYTGNFGGLSLDDSHVGNVDMVNWIHKGMTKENIADLQNAGLIPLSSHDATLWDWQGENGFKSSMVQIANQYIGKTFLLPLFKAKSSGTVTTAKAGTLPASASRLAAAPSFSLQGIQLVSTGTNLASLLQTTAIQTQSTNNGKKKANGKDETIDAPPPDAPPEVPPLIPAQPYEPGVGQGSNYYFNIVQFVGVKIMPPPDVNREVILQPTAFLEPFGTFTGLQPAGTHSSLVTTFATPKLTH